MRELKRMGMSFLLILGVLMAADGSGSPMRYVGAILLGFYAAAAYDQSHAKRAKEAPHAE